MINYISKYFTLNRRERNGMIAIVSLLFVLITVKYFIIYKYNPTISNVQVITLDNLAAELAAQNKGVAVNDYAGKLNDKKDSLFYFDPNTIAYEQAVRLGFPERTAHTLVNYRNKGGKFYKPDDLQKLYGMNVMLFDKLKPFVQVQKNNSFADKFKSDKREIHFANKQQNLVLEINTADSLDWMKLKGIGPGRARSILKYRKMLGGFYSVEQVKEAYFITDSLYNTIKANLTVNPALVQKIKVNSVDFKTMVHHPYIKYEGTKCIFALKRNKKIVANDLINSSCFSREQLEKVLVYLDFEQ